MLCPVHNLELLPQKTKYSRLFRKLAQFLGLPLEQTHIGMFDQAACRRVIEFCEFVRGN